MANNDSAQPIVFNVPGVSGPAPAAATRGAGAPLPSSLPGRVKASVQLGSLRGGQAPLRLAAIPGEDIVALHITGGPVLLLHPATARDLLQGPAGAQRGSAEVAVQAELHWPGADASAPSRGLGDVGRVVVSAFQVLTGLIKDPAADFVASQVVQHVDGQVEAGVYALQASSLGKLKDSGHKLGSVAPSSEPILVLVHGTFVETTSTFGKLWSEHPDSVQRLFARYKNAVYALDHPTLGASPIANARTLVDALPGGARLHLVTHSRGGLVAEVLARVAGQRGVGAADLAFFADPAYAGQQRELRELGALVQAKGLKVERVVRVACPARGTLLASKRMDAYVSVLKWALEATGLAIAPAFIDFIGEVARRRADPSQIPGLAAMIPGTPIVNWLNAAPQPIPGDLRVVAGDLQHGSTVGSWLKALLADAYYWTDNDIVVHTRSMYGGAPRLGGACFMLDQSAQATHFSYFVNANTAIGIVDALLVDAPAGFRPIGPLSWAGEDAGGVRGAVRAAADPSRPAVFVLPGIVGSNLKQGQPPNEHRIWLSARLIGGLDRLEYKPSGADQVSEDGPIGAGYDKLVAHLSASHEVLAFGYDWRRPLEEEAARLALSVTQALDARKSSGQPVRILAHSMGGLLARTMQLVAPDVWQRLMAHADARLVMLGTPNGGSWSPMQVLSGDDSFTNILAAIGTPFDNQRARQLMAAMPGFIQLQAGLLDPQLALDQQATWKKLADNDYACEQQKNWWHRYCDEMIQAAYQWGVPEQAVLDQAKALRRRLDAQLTNDLPAFADKTLLVTGHAKFTPDGFVVDASGFSYLDAQDGGDGRVPIESALLPGVKTWTMDCVHGDMPSTVSAFSAYTDLLLRGTTTALPPLPAARGAAAVTHVRNRPSRQPASALPAGTLAELFGAGAAEPAGPARATPALQITVLNGNLTFVRQPLLLGHYRALELTGTEGVVDSHLGGSMSKALTSGLYPEAPGEQRIFVNTRGDSSNPWRPPRPQAAIVIGLGEEGTLTPLALERSVCQGVKAWAQRASEGATPNAPIELAATLIGSGGLGVSAGSAARSIARGVWLANQRLAGTGWPLVARLTLVEWYLDRATEAWRGLTVLAQSSQRDFELAPAIASGIAPLRRQPESGYRGAAYDLISTSTASDGTIAFALDTRRARTEVRAQRTQPALLRKLVERAATSRDSDPRLGSTLFQLLVPLELKPFLSGTDRVLLQLDEGTAPIPWELLDTGAGDGRPATDVGDRRPWAIRTRLLRKMAISDFRNAPRDASAEAAVLIIGEPKVDDPNYPELPGARSEAEAVAAALGGPGGLDPAKINLLADSPEFDAVIVALMAEPYRIVHVAGHGAPVQRDGQGKVTSRGGVVLSQGVFLGPDEIEKLSVVPELVFVNCCHLGGHEASQSLKIDEPVAFAAGVADALIAIGVRCVVAAGWAVEDDPAKAFATAFYRTLLIGRPFIEAVAAARQAAYDMAPAGKTWAAYQCYGDPNWVLRQATADAQGASGAARQEAEGIASAPGLALALETLAVRTRFDAPSSDAAVKARQQAAAEKLRALNELYAARWGGIGAIAEAFGLAWDAAGDVDAAISWYQRAARSGDGSASLKSSEQLANLQARRAWNRVSRLDHAGQTAIDAARREIQGALDELRTLSSLGPTVERLSLIGSAAKRMSMLETRSGRAPEAASALRLAIDAYRRAEQLAIETGDSAVHYPALNRMALEVAAQDGKSAWPGFDAADLLRVRQSLEHRVRDDPDFWSLTGIVELEMYECLSQKRLAARADELLHRFADIHLRVAAPRMWASVADQADFVLPRYARISDAGQRAAALRILERLHAYAQSAPPKAAQVSAKRRRQPRG